MYIRPEANLVLLTGSPCDADYTNTLWFNTAEEQKTYFLSIAKKRPDQTPYRFTDFSTVRVNGNTVRVPVNCDLLYDVNYMMFQNTHYGNKWFYAFVTKVVYVNNEVTELVFSVDVIQTWLKDFDINAVFVEREHTVTDVIGENTVPENVTLGQIVSDDPNYITELIPTSIVCALPYQWDELGTGAKRADGTIRTRVYSGMNYITATCDSIGLPGMNGFLNVLTEQQREEIAALFIMPTCMIVGANEGAKVYDYTIPKNKTSIGNYTVINKKLLTHPYNYLSVTNLEGQNVDLCYELFEDNDNCTFKYTGSMSCTPDVMLYPFQYDGSYLDNFSYNVSLTNFPQCAYNIDTYKAWASSDGVVSALTGLEQILMRGATLGLAGARGAVVAGAMGASANVKIASLLGQSYKHELAPYKAVGKGGGSALYSIGKKTFAFIGKHIKTEMAKVIDDYFQMYGYAINQVKVPERNSRPDWNYVKTIGCTISGTMPTDDEKLICKIHDNGITYWHGANKVGKYTQYRNRPTEE